MVEPKQKELKAMKTLRIEPAKWLDMYNLDVTLYIETIKSKQGQEKGSYVSWAYAQKLMIEHFPNLDVGFQYTESGSIYHIDKTAFNVFDNFVASTKELLLLNPTETLGEHREQSLLNLLDDGYRYIQENVNGFLLPYIYDVDSLARTECLYYPLMKQGAFPMPINGIPTNMDLNKNIARAKVKAIGVFTGIGFRLWSTEDYDSEKLNVIDNIIKANDNYKSLAKKDHIFFTNSQHKLNVGTTMPELMELGKAIADDYRKLQKK